MEDIIKSMKAHLYDRASSPLIFSFVCSWTVWNYRLIIVLMSGSSPPEKFKLIDSLPKSHTIFTSLGYEVWPSAYWVYVGFIGPLIMTLVYLLILPYWEAKAFKLSSRKTVELKTIKIEAENATAITEDERIHLREMIRAADKQRDDAIEEQRKTLHSDISELQSQLAQAQSTSIHREKDLNATIDALRNEITEVKKLKDDLQRHLGILEGKIPYIYSLPDRARELLSQIPENGSMSASTLIQDHEKGEALLKKLEEAALIEFDRGYVEQTPLGITLNRTWQIYGSQAHDSEVQQ